MRPTYVRAYNTYQSGCMPLFLCSASQGFVFLWCCVDSRPESNSSSPSLYVYLFCAFVLLHTLFASFPFLFFFVTFRLTPVRFFGLPPAPLPTPCLMSDVVPQRSRRPPNIYQQVHHEVAEGPGEMPHRQDDRVRPRFLLSLVPGSSRGYYKKKQFFFSVVANEFLVDL